VRDILRLLNARSAGDLRELNDEELQRLEALCEQWCLGRTGALSPRITAEECATVSPLTRAQRGRTCQSTQHTRHHFDHALLVRELGQNGSVGPLLQYVGACVAGVKHKGDAAVRKTLADV